MSEKLTRQTIAAIDVWKGDKARAHHPIHCVSCGRILILYVFFIIQSRSTAHSCPPSIFSPFLIISLKKERERGNPSVLLNTAAHSSYYLGSRWFTNTRRPPYTVCWTCSSSSYLFLKHSMATGQSGTEKTTLDWIGTCLTWSNSQYSWKFANISAENFVIGWLCDHKLIVSFHRGRPARWRVKEQLSSDQLEKPPGRPSECSPPSFFLVHKTFKELKKTFAIWNSRQQQQQQFGKAQKIIARPLFLSTRRCKRKYRPSHLHSHQQLVSCAIK